ncbi:putative multidrug efflux membrane permease, partial [Operophtera brumata]
MCWNRISPDWTRCRMAWVLAQDVAACSQQPRAHCSASAPPVTTPLLTALCGIIFYPPNL